MRSDSSRLRPWAQKHESENVAGRWASERQSDVMEFTVSVARYHCLVHRHFSLAGSLLDSPPLPLLPILLSCCSFVYLLLVVLVVVFFFYLSGWLGVRKKKKKKKSI